MTTLAALQDQLNAIQAQIDGMKAMEKYWPQNGDSVYLVSNAGVIELISWEYDKSFNSEFLAQGRIFRTEAEATRERDRRALIAELRRHPKAIVPAWGSPPFYYLVREWDKGWRWVTGYNFDCCPASGYFSEPVDGLIEQLGSRLDLLRGV